MWREVMIQCGVEKKEGGGGSHDKVAVADG